MIGTIVRTPARYRKPGLDGGGWDGPAILLKFTSTKPAVSVFMYYAAQTSKLRWVASKNNALGYPQGWTKTYPDGTRAVLTLTDLPIRTTAGGTPSTYILNASA